MRTRSTVTALFATGLLLLAPACSDDDQDDARETVEDAADSAEETASDAADSAGEVADDGRARAAAEALRAALSTNDTAEAEGVRSVAAIEEAVEGLPGDPEVSGIDDGDGDGLDDDGKVQVDADESAACVTLPEAADDSSQQEGDEGEATDRLGDIEVEGGAC